MRAVRRRALRKLARAITARAASLAGVPWAVDRMPADVGPLSPHGFRALKRLWKARQRTHPTRRIVQEAAAARDRRARKRKAREGRGTGH